MEKIREALAKARTDKTFREQHPIFRSPDAAQPTSFEGAEGRDGEKAQDSEAGATANEIAPEPETMGAVRTSTAIALPGTAGTGRPTGSPSTVPEAHGEAPGEAQGEEHGGARSGIPAGHRPSEVPVSSRQHLLDTVRQAPAAYAAPDGTEKTAGTPSAELADDAGSGNEGGADLTGKSPQAPLYVTPRSQPKDLVPDLPSAPLTEPEVALPTDPKDTPAIADAEHHEGAGDEVDGMEEEPEVVAILAEESDGEKAWWRRSPILAGIAAVIVLLWLLHTFVFPFDPYVARVDQALAPVLADAGEAIGPLGDAVSKAWFDLIAAARDALQ